MAKPPLVPDTFLPLAGMDDYTERMLKLCRRLGFDAPKKRLNDPTFLANLGLVFAFQQPEFQRPKTRGRPLKPTPVDRALLVLAVQTSHRTGKSVHDCIRQQIRWFKKSGQLLKHVDPKTHKTRLFRYYELFGREIWDVVLDVERQVKKNPQVPAFTDAFLNVLNRAALMKSPPGI
jgi:hypothetical protein